MVNILGAPFDYCGYRFGSRMGPSAVRLAHLATTLESVGAEVCDLGDVQIGEEETAPGGLRNFEPGLATYRALRARTLEICQRGDLPLFIGGDHSCSMGTIAGALAAYGDDLAVLWIDAHTDLNTPAGSPSGNLHGMSLGGLLGLPCQVNDVSLPFLSPEVACMQWRTLLEMIGPRYLQPNRVGWFAVRDVDPAEQRAYYGLDGGFMATMYDIDRYSIVHSILNIDAWMRRIGAKRLWISFDVDALDPFLAPGTGTAVRGGLTYREMHLLGEMIHESLSAPDCPYALAGLDLVEVNPLFDTNNETARTAVEWIASLFGKTILGKR